ncbi:protein SHORT-ROOT-like [Amaranthus tricolor]|uniref:protein SHORT-ROOT-like n=1 Tax=Amaranthus tricolor TaxID=29722 RepID=UPI00258CBE32|nr:protein SHORT-ROOT-like [Amaranthus tricolor]
MPHSIENSSYLRSNDCLQPKKNTSFPLQLPNKWMINQTIKIPLIKNIRDPNKFPPNTTKSCIGWVLTLVQECAKAISQRNPSKTQQLLWVLNEVVSPYGDCDQRVAYYFLKTLFAKANSLGHQSYETLKFVEEKNYCFDTYVKLLLKFQEVSPWISFGHVASNGAILEALEGENNLHIIDLSNTLCTQWPMLLEALATRNDDTPHLSLTLVVSSNLELVITKEITKKMEKFARLMGVPFKFNVIGGLDHLDEIKKEDLGIQDGEAIVVNCIQALQRVQEEKRSVVIDTIRSLNPSIVTIVEEEIDLTNTKNDFLMCFEECFRFYKLYFEMLEESFLPISNERLKLERLRSRQIVKILACDIDSGEEYWRPNKASQWTKKLKEAFSPFHFNEEIIGDVQALLRRYNTSWDLALPQRNDQVGIHLKWKDENVVWASSWKPNPSSPQILS